MPISPIQNRPSQESFSQKPMPFRTPQGIAQTPDRMQPSRWSQENPPSLFKEYVFEPLLQGIKWLLRGMFTLIDFLRNSAFEEAPRQAEPNERDDFLNHLRAAPRPNELLFEFESAFSPKEQDKVYRAIGAAHPESISWKEIFRNRTPQENIELGRQLVKENPFLLQDFLA